MSKWLLPITTLMHPCCPFAVQLFSCEYHADCKQLMGCSCNAITDIDIDVKGALCSFGE